MVEEWWEGVPIGIGGLGSIYYMCTDARAHGGMRVGMLRAVDDCIPACWNMFHAEMM